MWGQRDGLGGSALGVQTANLQMQLICKQRVFLLLLLFFFFFFGGGASGSSKYDCSSETYLVLNQLSISQNDTQPENSV